MTTYLGATSRRLLLTLHVAVAASVLGADLVLVTLGLAGATLDPVAVYPAAELIASRVVAPLAIAALATGILLALGTSYGLTRYWWTAIKLAITLTLSALVTFVLVPALGAAADAALAGQPLSDSRRLPLLLAPAGATALLVLNIGLGIFKPGWKLRGRVRSLASVRDAAS